MDNDQSTQTVDSPEQLAKRVEEYESLLQNDGDSADHLYNLCLNLRALGQTEKALKYFEAVPRYSNWFTGRIESSVAGVLGFIGLAVLLNQTSPELVNFFKQTGLKVGESASWSDVRLAVPYALFLNRETKPDHAATVLYSCIKSGIAPENALVSDNERISPYVLLLSLYQEIGDEDRLYQFIGEMPDLLNTVNLEMEKVFEVVLAQDQALFDHIFTVLRKRSPSHS